MPTAGRSPGFDIAVTRDLNGIRAALKRAMPDADIMVEGLADGIVLTGSVASPAEAQQAYDLAARLAGDGNKVVNGITVRGRDQVMLQGDGRGGAARGHQAARHRSRRQRELRQCGRQFNNTNPFPINAPHAQRDNVVTGAFSPGTIGEREAARDGARRRHPHAGGTESDGDFRRDCELPCRRRVPGPAGSVRSPTIELSMLARSNSRSSASA
jgi:pilus assembly protein CpaC